MTILANSLVAFVALLQISYMCIEMFFWTHPVMRERFRMSEEYAERSKVLAANQGVYNGFLAAGLIWSLLAATDGFALKLFFLGCVLIAGLYGGATAKRSIFYIQALPAALALAAVLLAR